MRDLFEVASVVFGVLGRTDRQPTGNGVISLGPQVLNVGNHRLYFVH